MSTDKGLRNILCGPGVWGMRPSIMGWPQPFCGNCTTLLPSVDPCSYVETGSHGSCGVSGGFRLDQARIPFYTRLGSRWGLKQFPFSCVDDVEGMGAHAVSAP